MKQMGRKLMGLAMSLVLLAVLLPGTAKAESVPPTGPAGLDLTQAEDVTYSYGENGTANWVKSTHTLTLSGDGKIEAEGDNKGITLPAGSQLVVAENAHWTVKGADSESAGYHGIHVNGDLTLEIKENASLDTAGGNCRTRWGGSGVGVDGGALTAEVAETGSLTAVGGDSSERGGYGIRSGLLHLTNNGTVRAASGKTKDAYSSIGLWSYSGAGTSSISGTGRLLCMGELGITVQKEGIGHPGALKIDGGTVIAVGQSLSGCLLYTSRCV